MMRYEMDKMLLLDNLYRFHRKLLTKYVLNRGDFVASLQPQLAAKWPLADCVPASMDPGFEKVESLHLGIFLKTRWDYISMIC